MERPFCLHSFYLSANIQASFTDNWLYNFGQINLPEKHDFSFQTNGTLSFRLSNGNWQGLEASNASDALLEAFTKIGSDLHTTHSHVGNGF